MVKIIYAILVNTGAVGTCLDAMRLLASPSAKRFSHLTVRGPYSHRLDEETVSCLNAKLEPNGIYIVGAGNFFDSGENQNTVFFRCEGEALESVWDKTEYGFEPHVTVYDGPDRIFAKSVFDIMSKYNYHVRCGGDELVPFEIGNGKNGFLADLLRVQDLPEELSLTEPFVREVVYYTTQQRLEQIDKICSYLSKISERH